MDKIWDETYNFEIYTEGGKRFVFCSYDGSTGYTKEFETREELNKIITDYIADADYLAGWVHMPEEMAKFLADEELA